VPKNTEKGGDKHPNDFDASQEHFKSSEREVFSTEGEVINVCAGGFDS